MKLLLDENLSHRVLSKIADLYPGSSHVKDHNLIQADDEAVWTYAKLNDFIIVSKDSAPRVQIKDTRIKMLK